MDSQTRLGLELFAAALVLGVLGDAMLRATPWGLNASLWIGCLAVTGYGLAFRWRTALVPVERWMLVPVCAFALLYLGRDAGLLKLANTLAVLAACGLGMQRAQWALNHHQDPALTDPPGLLLTGAKALFRLPRFLHRDIDWQVVHTEKRGEQARAALRGVLLATPVLGVFGVLLVSADAVFESIMVGVFDVNLALVPGHVLLTFALTWGVGGFLYGVLARMDVSVENQSEGAEKRQWPVLGIVEVTLVLGLVSLLFAAFVLVQIPYFFGGHSTVLDTAGLTMAQYARRGFFELVTVASLALPLLLILRRVLVVRAVRDLRLFHTLAGVQVGLLFLMLGSAAQRMWLYQQIYGLSTLRLYVSAILLWLTLVLGWLLVTVLRDHAERFVPGAVAAGFLIVAGLHLLNPDALIVHTNLARATEEMPFDTYYASRLSADAVPALLDGLDTLPLAQQQELAAHLLLQWAPEKPRDWRTWSRSRAVARQAIATEAPRLWMLASPLLSPSVSRPATTVSTP
jgi:hypothetical protein